MQTVLEAASYYTKNQDDLTSYYDRGIPIPETREPGLIHYARLGSMEANNFTLIVDRMKDRRACWSIHGANNLALLLCLRHTTSFGGLFEEPLPLSTSEPEYVDNGSPISASKMPFSVGSGNEFCNCAFLPNISWLRGRTFRNLRNLTFLAQASFASSRKETSGMFARHGTTASLT